MQGKNELAKNVSCKTKRDARCRGLISVLGQKRIEMRNCSASFLACCVLLLASLAGGERLPPEKKVLN